MPEDTLSGPEPPRPDPLPAAMLAIAEHAERLDDRDGPPGRNRPAARSRSSNCWMTSRTAPDTARSRPRDGGCCPQRTGRRRLDRLAAWVEQVYATSAGHLARSLAPCWPHHDLCLFVLDFVSELHSVLYLRQSRSARTLADQAEFHLRILPAAAELMKAETTRCDHSHLRGVVA